MTKKFKTSLCTPKKFLKKIQKQKIKTHTHKDYVQQGKRLVTVNKLMRTLLISRVEKQKKLECYIIFYLSDWHIKGFNT